MDGSLVDEVILKYRYPILIILLGIILILGGTFLIKGQVLEPTTTVEIIENTDNPNNKITVEISGEVINPGVYTLSASARLEELMTLSGGLTSNADKDFVSKNLNRAAKLSDGQKVYIPSIAQQTKSLTANNTLGDQSTSTNILTDSTNKININSATLSQLDTLPGIGPTYGQKIIEHRPYSSVEELLNKKVLTQSVYKKIKDLVSVY